MKIPLCFVLLTALVLANPVFAAPPSDKSIEQLLEASKAGKMMDSVWTEMDGFMKQTMKSATKGQKLSSDDQAILDKQQEKIVALMKDELSWAKLKPGFVKIYQDTFTQEEVDGLIAFYQSPAGKALVEKQPELMRNTMLMMQERMGPLMQKIQAMAQETAKEMSNAKAQK